VNTTLAVVIRVEVPSVENVILLAYVISVVELEEPGIRSTDPNIMIDNNCTDDKLYLRCQGPTGVSKMKLI